MIPIKFEQEPDDFDKLVRQPGHEYLVRNPEAKASDLPPLWRNVLPELWEKYKGICAYYSIYLPKSIGAYSVDHFVAKSKLKELAYEWSNYRLASLSANQKKFTHEILDPFEMEQDTFFIQFANGEICLNPQKAEAYRVLCQKTIECLELNSQDRQRMRRDDFNDYINGHVDLDFLRRNRPFVHYEIIRQGLDKK